MKNAKTSQLSASIYEKVVPLCGLCESDLIAGKPRQSGCPAGMRCRYMHDYIDMHCVDEDYDSSEDSDEYDTYEDWESHSQEGEITVIKSCI